MENKKSILFVCVENSGRSQMAEGFAKSINDPRFEIFSAGSKPSGVVNPIAIKVMGELGIDISRNKSKGFLDLPKKKFDYVVTMGCQDVCPFVPANNEIDWKLEDPKGKDLDAVRIIRDEISLKVRNLIDII